MMDEMMIEQVKKEMEKNRKMAEFNKEVARSIWKDLQVKEK